MQKAGRIISRILIGIVILALIAGAGGMFYFKSYLPNTVAEKSFPQIDGQIKVDGLDGAVDIYRDNMGIPHIYARRLCILRRMFHREPFAGSKGNPA